MAERIIQRECSVPSVAPTESDVPVLTVKASGGGDYSSLADAVTAGIARLRLNPAIGRAEFNAQRIVNARIQGMLAEPHEPGL